MRSDGNQFFSVLFEATDDAVMVIDRLPLRSDGLRDFRYVAMNPKSQTMFGVPDLTGQTVRDNFPDEDEGWYDLYDQAIQAGEVPRFERQARFRDMVLQMHLVRIGAREEGRVMVTMRDITQRKRAERLLRDSEVRHGFLLKLSDLLQTLSQEQDIKAAAMHALGEQLGVSRAQYHECDSTGEYYDADGIGYANGIPLLTEKYRIEEAGSFVNEDFAAGRPFRSDDLWEDPRVGAEERAFYETYNIRAGAGAPLIRGERLVAILAVHDVHPHPWSDTEMALIRETAERVWTAVERARSEVALRGREERQAFLLMLADRLQPIQDPPTLKAEAMGMLREYLGVDQAHYYEPGPDGAHLNWQESVSPHASLSRHGRTDVLPLFMREAFDRGETVLVRDVATDWRMRGADPLFCAFLGVPVCKSGRCVAAIGLEQSRLRNWTQEDIALAADVAERTWAMVERARAEQALRDSEERFQQFANASAAGLWIRDGATLEMEFVSPSVGTIYGVEPDVLLGDVKRWAAMIVPEDRDAALEHLEAACGGSIAVHEFRVQRKSDDVFRWVRNTDFPLRDDHGIARVGGIVEDITETRQLAEHGRVLLAELQHRVRNIMAMIRSMTGRTAEGSVDVEDYRDRLEGRLMALARVQVLLTREANVGGSLRNVLESEVGAVAHHAGQLEATGPEVMLPPKGVEVLTLAFHELATNALKYGALASTEGRIKVTWGQFRKREAPWLAIDWVEEGGPSTSSSTRRGFGSELIEARIPYELGGVGSIIIEPGGARCHMELPLKDGESILETDAPMPVATYGGSLDMSQAPDLSGSTVLIVEDDYYTASDTAAALRGAGAEVLGPCPSEDTTRQLLEHTSPTAVVLDLNLGGGGPRFEIARLLRQRNIPFIFLTGYDPEVVPAEMTDVPRLQKPVRLQEIVEAVAQLGAPRT